MLRNTLAAIALSIASSALQANTRIPVAPTPGSAGIPIESTEALVDSLLNFDNTVIHSIIVMRDGNIEAAVYPKPFSSESGQQLYSVSKTFVAMAVGILVDENRLRLDDRVALFFNDALPESIPEAMADITVKDLLTMQSGIKPDWNGRSKSDNWVENFFKGQIVDEPGKTFAYDSMCSYMLSAIVSKLTGRTVFDILNEQVFKPLGIEEVCWEVSPEGYSTGGWGLYLKPESLAKCAQLLLQEGQWEGNQLLPQQWVKDMMTKHVDVDQPNLDNYCLQMWTCNWPQTARMDGAMGQFAFVIPDKSMVIVITQSLTGKTSGPKEQSWLWSEFMPTIDSPDAASAPSKKQINRFLQKINNASLPTPQGARKSKHAARLSNSTLAFEKPEQGIVALKINLYSKQPSIELTDTAGTVTSLALAYKNWPAPERIAYKPANSLGTVRNAFSGLNIPFEASASYAWTDPEHLEVMIYYTNWGSSARYFVDCSEAEPQLSVVYNWAPDQVHKVSLK